MSVLKIHDYNENEMHFLTFTVIEWIDIFTNFKYFEELIKILKFYQLNSGLEIYGYVFMTNHVHFLWKAKPGFVLSDIVKNFKSYSTYRIKSLLESESRKYIHGLIKTSKYKRKDAAFQIWQEYNYPEVVTTEKFFQTKLQYIHNNPVKKGYVINPEDWLYSSARNYIKGDNLILRIDKFEQ